MLAIDVGDDRDDRRQPQERAVALVGLDDHAGASPETRVAAEGAETPADDGGRIEAGPVQHQRHHRRRRGLAVRAGDGNPVLEPHELGQHLGARDDGNRPRAGLDDLGIRRTDGGRHDDDVGVVDLRRGEMTFEYADPERHEAIASPPTSCSVRAGHGVAEIGQHFRNPAHADPADAHEVNVSRSSEHRAVGFGLRSSVFGLRGLWSLVGHGRATGYGLRAFHIRHSSLVIRHAHRLGLRELEHAVHDDPRRLGSCESRDAAARRSRRWRRRRARSRAPPAMSPTGRARRASPQRLPRRAPGRSTALVIVGCRRQRHEQRRTAHRRQLGERRRSGTAHDHVRVSHRRAHVLDEGFHPSAQSDSLGGPPAPAPRHVLPSGA